MGIVDIHHISASGPRWGTTVPVFPWIQYLNPGNCADDSVRLPSTGLFTEAFIINFWRGIFLQTALTAHTVASVEATPLVCVVLAILTGRRISYFRCSLHSAC